MFISKSFMQYLEESAEVKQLKHLYHPEELIFLQGEEGVSAALDFLKGTYTTLHKKSSSVKLSRKWDGAPSTVFGHIDGKFFVGSKSVFNATPKINYTDEDIDKNHSEAPGLAAKLKIALEHLKKVTPNNGLIYQCDFLFDDEIKKRDKVNGVDSITFRPNTITYTVDRTTPLGKQVSAAKMGIVIHTFYKNLQSSAQFLPDLSKFKKTKDVFITDANFELGDTLMFSSDEDTKFLKLLSEAERIEKTLEGKNFYDNIKSLSALITTFNNTMIRENKKLNSSSAYDALFNYIDQKLQKEIDKVSSAAAKTKKTETKQTTLNTVTKNKSLIISAYDLYNAITEIKMILIKKFNTMKKFGTFINNGSAFVPTNEEGFVVIGEKGVVKLVDRFEFSQLNFNLVKTW